ncbi:MAG: hypothetical protein OXF79_19560 [Chloroflexi bacterium]|nr:hypothetical protein [Chloroflexota bacterium]
MIASLAGVAVALRALLAQPVGLVHLRRMESQVDGQRISARAGASGPASGQRLPGHPIELADMAPPETPQKGPQRGWRLHDTTQHPLGPASAQRIGVIDVRHRRTTGQRHRRQGQQLIPWVCPTRHISQINAVVQQLSRSQMTGQGDQQDQSSVRHQAVIIEGDGDVVRALAR